jgi:glycosyltransferase involved in cell wall biosynthesis
LRFRPQWIYASDPLACPAALLLSRLLPSVRMLYHEHDSPSDQLSVHGFQRLVLGARRQLTRRAELCVLPNEQRAIAFNTTLAPPRPAVIVWNCPRIDEVAPPCRVTQGELLTLYYHGNIGPHLLPNTILDAMAALRGRLQLNIVGYETIGTYRYLETFRETAERLGIASYVRINPALPRHQLWAAARTGDIGLVLLGRAEGNINLRFLTGASNKVFDYLACGMVLLVPDLPDWHKLCVEPGYGLACDPADPASIVGALLQLLDNPAERHAMGERGRQRILSEWNYERQFEPVLAHLESRALRVYQTNHPRQ